MLIFKFPFLRKGNTDWTITCQSKPKIVKHSWDRQEWVHKEKLGRILTSPNNQKLLNHFQMVFPVLFTKVSSSLRESSMNARHITLNQLHNNNDIVLQTGQNYRSNRCQRLQIEKIKNSSTVSFFLLLSKPTLLAARLHFLCFALVCSCHMLGKESDCLQSRQCDSNGGGGGGAIESWQLILYKLQPSE